MCPTHPGQFLGSGAGVEAQSVVVPLLFQSDGLGKVLIGAGREGYVTSDSLIATKQLPKGFRRSEVDHAIAFPLSKRIKGSREERCVTESSVFNGQDFSGHRPKHESPSGETGHDRSHYSQRGKEVG